jgi:hypothetical protein
MSEYATADLGYNVELERTRAKFDGAVACVYVSKSRASVREGR